MSDDFYRAFEDRHRGSRELIKSRQRIYLPFIKPLLSIYSDANALDLGCGRGEWLELLKESGFDAQGVDLDDGMLAACRELGLKVATADVLVALKALPDASQTVVSGFHLAEHIQFSDLQILVQEALRVLKPAGLLILETPNPENVIVATTTFYMDPTHQRPIPPALLAFVAEFHGFARVKVLRLQEASAIQGEWPSLWSVLAGVSPDYAVVAQKNAPSLASTEAAFSTEYGVSIQTVVSNYDITLKELLNAQQALLQRTSEAQHNAAQAEAKARNYQQALELVYNSSSWRATSPLRWGKEQLCQLRKLEPIIRAKASTIKVIKLAVGTAQTFVDSHPQLRSQLAKIARRLGIYKYLRTHYRRWSIATQKMPTQDDAGRSVDGALIQLSERARNIYEFLTLPYKKPPGCGK
jgi:O-antigen chain-terminating methyltransferase